MTLYFYIVILFENHVMRCTIATRSSLSRWLCWEVRCLMWLFIRYILLRLLVKTCMSWDRSFVLARGVLSCEQ